MQIWPFVYRASREIFETTEMFQKVLETLWDGKMCPLWITLTVQIWHHFSMSSALSIEIWTRYLEWYLRSSFGNLIQEKKKGKQLNSAILINQDFNVIKILIWKCMYRCWHWYNARCNPDISSHLHMETYFFSHLHREIYLKFYITFFFIIKIFVHIPFNVVIINFTIQIHIYFLLHVSYKPIRIY